MKIFVSCPRGRIFNSFFDDQNIELAEKIADVVWNPYGERTSRDAAVHLIEGCDVYMTAWGSPTLNEEMLKAAPNLKLLTHLGGDPKPFMCDRAWKKGIKVISGEDYLVSSAAEGTLAYILSALRKIPEYSARLKYQNEWRHSWDSNQGLIGKTVGIVNYSAVAAALVKLINPFGVKIYVYDEQVIPSSDAKKYCLTQIKLNEIFTNSDIICIFTPTNGTRYHMISSEQLTRIKKGALLVDTSTGGVINQNSLALALMNNRFFAVLDVYEKEPPVFDEILFSSPNVTLMPHMAGPTPDTRQVIARELLLESANFIDLGIPLKHKVRRSLST